jgi:hypothetical protein
MDSNLVNLACKLITSHKIELILKKVDSIPGVSVSVHSEDGTIFPVSAQKTGYLTTKFDDSKEMIVRINMESN